ncbi:MAG TPA: hypothetical protein VJJ20_01685 [Candidatus Paceibacterota bacterium]
MKKEPYTQREWWNVLSATTSESAYWKGLLDHDHSATKLQLEKDHGIRNVAGWWGQESQDKPIPEGYYDGLNKLHPRALTMLAKYGVEFWPFPWSELPVKEPKRHGCHFNSAFYQYAHNRVLREQKVEWSLMDYVEGISLGGYSLPVFHAWNTLASRPDMAIDSTWYATSGWMFYFGIAFSQDEFEYLRDLAYPDGRFNLILRKDVFCAIEEPLLQILEARVASSPQK